MGKQERGPGALGIVGITVLALAMAGAGTWFFLSQRRRSRWDRGVMKRARRVRTRNMKHAKRHARDRFDHVSHH